MREPDFDQLAQPQQVEHEAPLITDDETGGRDVHGHYLLRKSQTTCLILTLLGVSTEKEEGVM